MASTFSEYYRQQGQGRQSAPSPAYPEFNLKTSKKDDGAPQTPLNWVVDIISRPLFGATTAVGGALEGVAKYQETGNAGEAIGGVAAIPTNFLAGLISSDESPGSGTKRTYGDLMEEYTDRFGLLNNPDYVDVENNVDPMLRGSAGLALDIVADPLTWVPGALLFKGPALALKGAAKVAGGAAGAVKGGIQSVRGAGKAADVAADVAPAVGRQADEAGAAARQADEVEEANPFGGQAGSGVLGTAQAGNVPTPASAISQAAETALKVSDDVPTPSVKPGSAKASEVVADASRIGESTEDLRKLVDSSKFAPAMRSEVTKILANIGKPVQVANKIDFPKAADWARANAGSYVGEMPGYPAVSDQLNGLVGVATDPRYKSKPATFGRLLEISQKAPSEALRAEAKRAAQATYLSAKEAAGVAKVSDDAKGVLTAIDAFVQAKALNAQKLENIFGPRLLETLSRKNTEKSMRESMEKVLKFLDPETDLAEFFAKNKQLSAAIQEGLQIPRHVKPTPNTAAKVEAVKTALKEEPRLAAARVAFEKTIRSEIDDITTKYPYYEKATDTYFTSESASVRVGRRRHDLNTFFQYTLWKNAVSEVQARTAIIQGTKVQPGVAYAKAWREAMHSVGEDIGRISAELGIPLGIGVRSGKRTKGELLPISFDEVYRIVEKGFENEATMLRALYNGNSNVAFTVLMQSAHKVSMTGLPASSAARAAMKKELVEGILDPKKFGVRGTISGKEALIPNRIQNPGKMGGFDKKVPTGRELAESLAEAILKQQDELVKNIAANSTAWAERGLAEATLLNQSMRKKLSAAAGNGYRTDMAKAIDDIPKTVAEEGTEMGATQAAVNTATVVTRQGVGETAEKVAKTTAKASREIEAGKPRKQVVEKANQKVADDVGREADQFEEVVPPGGAGVADDVEFYDLSSPSPIVAQQGFLAHVLHGFNVGFRQDYGIRNVYNIWHSKKTVSGQFIEKSVQQIRQLNKLPKDVQVAAVKAVQSGTPNNSPAVTEAIELVENIMKPFWRVSDDAAKGSVMDNGFLAVERNLDYVHDIMAGKGLDDAFRFTGDTMEEAMQAWRTWDIKDPTDTFARLADAMATVAEKRGIVGNFVYEFTKQGFIKTNPEPGFVRVGSSGNSTFASLLPDGVYVQREMAKELHQLDILTRADRQLSGEIGTFLAKHFIPAQGIWKGLVTVWRPGHHIRNMVGNAMMSWVARGNRHYVQSNRDAVKVLATKRNNYSGEDLIASLQRTGESIPTGGEVLVRGRHGDITIDEIYSRSLDNGMFTSFAASEDLLSDAAKSSRLTQLSNRLNASRGGRLTGGVSQLTDHFGKMQHVIQIIRQESGKGGRWPKNISKDEMFKRAFREVKRSHPDANMLTTMEAKYRFLIPFYTWFAKTMPFAIESAARNPGRIAVFPKASYNIAVANGVNPESLIDPFPDDQLFPSYVTEGFFGPQFVGPDGEYVTVNPGIQHFDLFREIGVDPLRGMAGMMSPIIKAPFELMTGGSMQTGAKINDTSDYIDQNLPIVNYIANLSGYSVSGSIPSLLTGQGLDPQRQVERGNKGDYDKMLTLSNWLTGMSASNLSRQNFINFAEIEKRDRAAEEAKK